MQKVPMSSGISPCLGHSKHHWWHKYNSLRAIVMNIMLICKIENLPDELVVAIWCMWLDIFTWTTGNRVHTTAKAQQTSNYGSISQWLNLTCYCLDHDHPPHCSPLANQQTECYLDLASVVEVTSRKKTKITELKFLLIHFYTQSE